MSTTRVIWIVVAAVLWLGFTVSPWFGWPATIATVVACYDHHEKRPALPRR